MKPWQGGERTANIGNMRNMCISRQDVEMLRRQKDLREHNPINLNAAGVLEPTVIDQQIWEIHNPGGSKQISVGDSLQKN